MIRSAPVCVEMLSDSNNGCNFTLLPHFNRWQCSCTAGPKRAARFTLTRVSYKGQDAMRVNDVSNQLLHLGPADDSLLQMTGKAAFQQSLIDISPRGKLPPSTAKSWADTPARAAGRNKVLRWHPS